MNIVFLTIGELSNLSENAMYPDLLRCFQKNGHQVYAVCTRERRLKLPTVRQTEANIDVLRVRTGNITKTNLLEKGLSTLLIGVEYKRAIQKHFKKITFDLILYSTPPITISSTVKYLKKRYNAFTYLMLKDIFPRNALDLGILKKSGWKGILSAYFLSKEKKLYLQSDCIGVMSDANVRYLRENVPYLKDKIIEICPNTINPNLEPLQNKKILRDNFKLPQDKVIFICGGNFGKPQDVEFIVNILKNSQEKSDRHFVMIGSGTDFHKLMKYANQDNVSHITVFPPMGRVDFQHLLAACDVGLVFLSHRFSIPNFPSRLLDYMNQGMPVLAATDQNTDIGKTILEGAFGWWCESNDVSGYVKILDEICDNPMEIDNKGENSRKYLIAHYDTKIAYEKIMHSYLNIRN